MAWIDSNIIGKSASSLRIAVSAARHDYVARVRGKLKDVEELYLNQLMKTNDPVEGLKAFIEKREPVWDNDAKGAH